MEKQETNNGRSRQGTVWDAETGRTYSPYFLGPQVTLGIGAFCFVGSWTVVHDAQPTEPALGPDPDLTADEVADPRTHAPMTDVSAYYEPLSESNECSETPRVDTPP